MMAACINLKERFGNRFKVEFEESYCAERPEFRATEAPWLMIVRCEHGHICPAGGDLLVACASRRGAVARQLAALPFVTVVQDADDGLNALFDVEHFDEATRLMRPKRRRQLSAEQRQAAVERLKPFHFSARQRSGAGPERVRSGQVGVETQA
jgi:hypothetical protein